MFDTNIAVVGNVLNAPEWRRIASSGALVANFRVASTARRYDRENGRWIDGNNLRVRVVAWRRLAEGIASSITVGDPVIVYGRLYTRDWKDEQGNPRVSYEMEAFSIGHDLARGRARFFRNKAVLGTGTVEDAEAQSVLGGEPTDPVTAEEVPVGYGEGLPERLPDELEPTFAEQKQKQEQEQEQKQEEDEEQEREPASEQSPEAGPADDDELTLEVERLVAEQPTAARRGRRAKREPVAA